MKIGTRRNRERYKATCIDLRITPKGNRYIIISRNREQRRYVKPSFRWVDKLTRLLVKSVCEDTGRVYPQMDGWRWLRKDFDAQR